MLITAQAVAAAVMDIITDEIMRGPNSVRACYETRGGAARRSLTGKVVSERLVRVLVDRSPCRIC